MKNLTIALTMLLLAGAAQRKGDPQKEVAQPTISLAPVTKKPEMIDASDLLTNPKINPDLSGISGAVKASTGCKTKQGSVLAEGDAGYRQCVLDRETKPANQRPGEESSASFQFGK